MKPSTWLKTNLAQIIVALAQAGATLEAQPVSSDESTTNG